MWCVNFLDKSYIVSNDSLLNSILFIENMGVVDEV